MKLKVAGVILLVIALAIAASLGILAWRYYTADIKGIVDAQEQITSGANRIQEYERFFDLCAEAQTMQSSLEAQRSLLESTDDDKEKRRVNANIAGMTAQLYRIVNQYNSNASKDYTAARFHSSDLPWKLSVNQPILCSAE